MTLEIRGDDLVMLNVPFDFVLPEHYPVTWNPEHRAFAVPRRHRTVPALLKILIERELIADVPAGLVRRGARFA